MLNTEKVQAAAKIVNESALQFLADKHGLTVQEVVAAILSGNQRATEQYTQLVAKGLEQVKTMCEAGQISLG